MKRVSLLLVAFACLGAKPHTSGISLMSGWQDRYSDGVQLTYPLAFVFPAAPGHVNYVTTSYTMPITQAQAVTLSVRIDALSGVPSFDYGLGPDNSCAYPAHVRAYIEQAIPKHCPDVIYSCAPATARWWSNPIAIELTEGTWTASTPFTPDQWSDTFGERGTDAFQGFSSALAHPGAVGMTFGGGCFFGHGVNVSGGTARLVVTGYAIH